MRIPIPVLAVALAIAPTPSVALADLIQQPDGLSVATVISRTSCGPSARRERRRRLEAGSSSTTRSCTSSCSVVVGALFKSLFPRGTGSLSVVSGIDRLPRLVAVRDLLRHGATSVFLWK
jgi:hypothetical protein